MKIENNELIRDERGAGMLEYIILVGIIAILAIVGFGKFGKAVNDKVTKQSETVSKITDTGEMPK